MFKILNIKNILRTSLVAQWFRIHLPMQERWVWSLVREDPTSNGAMKPKRHSDWSPQSPEPVLCKQEKLPHGEARASQLESSPRSPQLEKAFMQQRRPSAANELNKLIFFKMTLPSNAGGPFTWSGQVRDHMSPSKKNKNKTEAILLQMQERL